MTRWLCCFPRSYIFKFIELLNYKVNIPVALILPGTRFMKRLVCARLREVDSEEIGTSDMAELVLEVPYQFVGVGSDDRARQPGLLFIRKGAPMPESKAHGRSGNSTTRRLLLAANSSHEGDTTPQKVLIFQPVCIPHNLQDGRTSMIPPAHEFERQFLGFIKRILCQHILASLWSVLSRVQSPGTLACIAWRCPFPRVLLW